MPDHQPSPLTKHLVITIVISALVSTSFGFAAGLFAGNSQVATTLLASFPALVRQPLSSNGPVAALGDEELRRIAAVKKAAPAVVSIVISKDVPVMEQYYENPFGDNGFGLGFPNFQMPQYRQKGTEHKQVGAGSGFLVSNDGYVVTNRHVVEDENAEYTVLLQDGRKIPAKILARDTSNDIAVLKINGKDFPSLSFGDSSSVQVGQTVIAIGYALGRFGNTVSSGIVSGLSRSITASGGGQVEDLFDVIQTDAAINPGNSGGPLLDLDGNAIGVNVAIVEGSQNIGFALPVNDVKKAVESVQKGGKIVRPFLGVRYVLVDKEIAQKNQLATDHGALVVRGDSQTDLAVLPGSPADLAGIMENDVILEVAGKKITAEYPLAVAIRGYGVGDKVQLKILHRGQEKLVTVTMAEKK